MYMRPAQCSPLRRSFTPGGCTTGRSSATDGRRIVGVRVPDLVGGQVEVLQDREASRTRLRRVVDGPDELVDAEPDLLRQDRQTVAAQYRCHQEGLLAGTAQMHGEAGAEADLLAVARRPLGVQQVEGVVDL